MSIVNMQRIVNCLTKLFLQILNFLFEIAVVRYRKQNLKARGIAKKGCVVNSPIRQSYDCHLFQSERRL